MSKKARRYKKDNRTIAAHANGTLMRRFRRKSLKEFYRVSKIWDEIYKPSNLKIIAAYDLSMGGNAFRLNLVRPSGCNVNAVDADTHYIPPAIKDE